MPCTESTTINVTGSDAISGVCSGFFSGATHNPVVGAGSDPNSGENDLSLSGGTHNPVVGAGGEIGNLPNAFTYTGRHLDPDERLYHYRARVYYPELGIFLQQDPVYSANPYSYVGNNPINAIDPLGLCPNCDEETITYTKSNKLWLCKGCRNKLTKNSNMRKNCTSIRTDNHTRGYGVDSYWWRLEGKKIEFATWEGCTECWGADNPKSCEELCGLSGGTACLEACAKGPTDAPDGGGPNGNSPNPGWRPGSPGDAPQGPGAGSPYKPGGDGKSGGHGASGGWGPIIGDSGWGKDLNPYDYFKQLRIKGHEDFPGEINSDIRHCTASCYASSNRGIPTAWLFGVANEAQGFLQIDIYHSIINPRAGWERWVTNQRPRAASYGDIEENEIGIIVGLANSNWQSCSYSCKILSEYK
ncbi:MAG: RHS repeat-associated core domain-containing protein [bacterium]